MLLRCEATDPDERRVLDWIKAMRHELRLGAFEAGDLKKGIAVYPEKRRPSFERNGYAIS